MTPATNPTSGGMPTGGAVAGGRPTWPASMGGRPNGRAGSGGAPTGGTAAKGAAAGSAHPAAELDGVSRHYPGGVKALDRVSVRIGAGELVGIVGPSGSGKSTLLNLLGTLDAPTAGTVRIAGHDVGALSDDGRSALRAQGIGFVFQQFHLAANVTALDNVAGGLLYTGLPMRRRRERAAAALRRVGLADRAGHRPHELSGGQQQRVAIARAVVGDPALILADEPTGALDTASGEAVIGLLRGLHSAGATIVIITHDREVAAGLPRRIHVRDGRIAADGRSADERSTNTGAWS